MSWKCPKCGSKQLKVEISTMAELIQDDPDNFETCSEGGDHEWDGQSTMLCGECHYSAKADIFREKEGGL